MHSTSLQNYFLLLLLILSSGGLVWLFFPFLPSLFLESVLAVATWPLRNRCLSYFHHQPQKAAITMTLLVAVLLVAPVVYLLTVVSIRVGRGIGHWHDRLTHLNPNELATIKTNFLQSLPLPEEFHTMLLGQMGDNLGNLAGGLKNISLFLFQNILGNTMIFFSSLGLILFALFFFYRDGIAIVERLKILSPLTNDLDHFLFRRFSQLATTLTLSTVGVATIQGGLLALVAFFLDLPWFFIGVAGSVTAFIPIFGSMVVWAPSAYYLLINGRLFAALFLVIWGLVVIGFLVDNIFRPFFIAWLGGSTTQENRSNPLNHTLIVVLSTFGGLLAFGILGLIFGPLMAAMAISIFEIYEMTHQQYLDHS